MYKYETHLHTLPVSKCAKEDVRTNLLFYKEKGYDGVFITNHFIDGNINYEPQYVGYGLDRNIDVETYYKMLDFYFADYEEALKLSKEIGIKVFLGVEISYRSTDFLVFGLDKEWYVSHPEILEMNRATELDFMRSEGALIIQAHPFRRPKPGNGGYIRVFVDQVDGLEVINACNSDSDNSMARIYAQTYGLLMTAGSDNHRAGGAASLAGVTSDVPINSVEDFIKLLKSGNISIFKD